MFQPVAVIRLNDEPPSVFELYAIVPAAGA